VLLNVTQITILTQEMSYFANETPKIIAVHANDTRCINTVRYVGVIVTYLTTERIFPRHALLESLLFGIHGNLLCFY